MTSLWVCVWVFSSAHYSRLLTVRNLNTSFCFVSNVNVTEKDIITNRDRKDPEAVTTKDEYGNLPLDTALEYKASKDVINLIFALKTKASNEIIKILLSANTEATKAQDCNGDLPLHYALYYKASNEIVKMIYDANPEAIKVQNNKGMLPLHFALYREASNEIIKMIFIANCEATKVQNIDGWLPLHCALYRVASPSVIKMLFEAYPEAITVHGKHGELPIDLYRGDNSEIILMLLKAYCEAARKNDAIRDSLENAIESGYWEAVGIAATLMSDDLYKAVKNKASCDEVKGVLVKYLEAATESNDVAFESAKELVQLVDTGDWEEVVLYASKFERNSPRSFEENLLPQRVSTFMPSHSGRISFDNTSRGTTGEDSVLPGVEAQRVMGHILLVKMLIVFLQILCTMMKTVEAHPLKKHPRRVYPPFSPVQHQVGRASVKRNVPKSLLKLRPWCSVSSQMN